MTYFVKSLLILIAASLSFCYLNKLTDSVQHSKIKYSNKVIIGASAPSFTIQRVVDSVNIESNMIFGRKPVVLLIFDPYCPFCRLQISEIVEHWTELKDVDFCFVTMFPFYQAKRTYNEFSLWKYKNILIGIDKGNRLTNYYSVSSVPLMLVYDRKGALIDTFNTKIGFDRILLSLNN